MEHTIVRAPRYPWPAGDSRVVPEPDNHGAKKPNLMVHLTSTEKEWTMVKFERDLSDVNEDQVM